MQTTYSVRELNAHIRQLFERDYELQDVWVEGLPVSRSPVFVQLWCRFGLHCPRENEGCAEGWRPDNP
jgi:hypothetical protein